MRIYLSGPMTGLPERNYPAFREAAAALRDKGHEVYNPADWENYGVVSGHDFGTRPFDLHAAFKDYCTYIIDEADAVVHLSGWERSPGATAEVSLAIAIGVPTLDIAHFGVSGNADLPSPAPFCPDHREVQHRDREDPWCNACGWRKGQAGEPAVKLGLSNKERLVRATSQQISIQTSGPLTLNDPPKIERGGLTYPPRPTLDL